MRGKKGKEWIFFLGWRRFEVVYKLKGKSLWEGRNKKDEKENKILEHKVGPRALEK